MPLEFSPQVLREVAENLVEGMIAEGVFPDEARDDMVTSLVRQWVTYDGNACVFTEDVHAVFSVGTTPLGQPNPKGSSQPNLWVKQAMESWRIDQAHLPDIINQLNRGQSAETTNQDDVPIRFWVNPKTRQMAVESLTGSIPKNCDLTVEQIAANELERVFPDLDEDEHHELAKSVAQQWRTYRGHASVFADGMEYRFIVLKVEEGLSEILKPQRPANLRKWFLERGVDVREVAGLIARINLGQDVHLEDRDGRRSRVWYDPLAGRLCQEPTDEIPLPVPVFCPQCKAVFPPPLLAQNQHLTCQHCGFSMMLPT